MFKYKHSCIHTYVLHRAYTHIYDTAHTHIYVTQRIHTCILYYTEHAHIYMTQRIHTYMLHYHYTAHTHTHITQSQWPFLYILSLYIERENVTHSPSLSHSPSPIEREYVTHSPSLYREGECHTFSLFITFSV